MTEWTTDAIAARFAEAVETARHLPPGRGQGYFNSWSMLAFQAPDRYPDPQHIGRPISPGPADIERMLETMRWVQWLDPESRHIVWMRADRYGWKEVCRRIGCDRSTAWRRWKRALMVVAVQLGAECSSAF